MCATSPDNIKIYQSTEESFHHVPKIASQHTYSRACDEACVSQQVVTLNIFHKTSKQLVEHKRGYNFQAKLYRA